MSARTASTPMVFFSGFTTCTSGWVPARNRLQAGQTPQGLSAPSHTMAWANSRATVRLPEPWGPASSSA